MKAICSILVVLILFVSGNVSAQNYNKQYTYLDAIQLSKLYKGRSFEDSQEFFSILGKYGITTQNIAIHPFFKNFQFEVIESNPIIIGDSSLLGQGPNPIVIPGTPEMQDPKLVPGMNWQAAAINGIATFMAGRFKEEVLHYGLENVFGQITGKDSLVVSGLFPKTYAHIKSLYLAPENSYYTADLLYLKQLVHIDLENLESNFLKNATTMFPKLSDHPNLIDGLTMGVGILDLIEREFPVDEIISRLSDKKYSSDSSIVGKTMNFMDLISMAFHDKEGSDRTWVNPRETLPVLGDSQKDLISNFFYGLLFQQLKEIPEFSTILDSLNENTKEISARLQEIGLIVNDLDNIVETIKLKDSDKLTNQEVIEIIRDLIDAVNATANILDEKFQIEKQRMLQATAIANDILSVRSYFLQKNYQLAIAEIVSVFGQYSTGSIQLSRALSFISGLASIKDDADMEKLLQAHALPIGGASIKRSSRFNLSINSYVGVTAGFESAFVSSGDPQVKGNVGLTAPIGISATFARGRLTSFASFFDLGSIVNQRLNNDTTSYTNLRFEQFFTPGAALYFNFKNAPISMGVNYCFIPNLRTIKYESGGATIGESRVSVSRINFSVLVDIPFFTLYNRSIGSTKSSKLKKSMK